MYVSFLLRDRITVIWLHPNALGIFYQSTFLYLKYNFFTCRAFWGDKSELRRFQDGSITETCVWEGESMTERRTVTKQIIDYLMQLKFGKRMSFYSVRFFDYLVWYWRTGTGTLWIVYGNSIKKNVIKQTLKIYCCTMNVTFLEKIWNRDLLPNVQLICTFYDSGCRKSSKKSDQAKIYREIVFFLQRNPFVSRCSYLFTYLVKTCTI